MKESGLAMFDRALALCSLRLGTAGTASGRMICQRKESIWTRWDKGVHEKIYAHRSASRSSTGLGALAFGIANGVCSVADIFIEPWVLSSSMLSVSLAAHCESAQESCFSSNLHGAADGDHLGEPHRIVCVSDLDLNLRGENNDVSIGSGRILRIASQGLLLLEWPGNCRTKLTLSTPHSCPMCTSPLLPLPTFLLYLSLSLFCLMLPLQLHCSK